MATTDAQERTEREEASRRSEHENDNQRLPREDLMELLEELRVMLPGTQVIFAFLLTVPFTSRFTEITDIQRTMYFVAFLAAAISTVLLIAPSAIHRIHRHASQPLMQRLLRVSTVLAMAGSLFLMASVAAVVYLITDVLYDERYGAIIGALIAALGAWLWFGLPLLRYRREA